VIEPLDRRIAELRPEPLIKHDHIGLGIADGRRTRREVAGHGGRGYRTPDGQGGTKPQSPTPVQQDTALASAPRAAGRGQINKSLQLHP
jgi:hypothetical protein